MNSEYQQYMTNIGLPPANSELLELFHESSKVMYSTALKRDLRIGAYLYDPRCVLEASRNKKLYQTCPITELPRPQRLSMALDDVFQNRISCRSFSGKDIGAQSLANILNALRVTRQGFSTEFEEVPMVMRSYPSPGGLYPVEVYVLAVNSDEIEEGVYHYDFDAQNLARIRALPAKESLRLMFGDHDNMCTNTATYAVVMTAILPRSTVKYEALGYRFALLESGIVGQHLSLAATAAGIGNLFWGSYYDDEIHDLIGLDGVEEIVTNFLWLGDKL
ncbi:SagB/ThcOx family dehydrogenase [Alkalimonas collagenimarina]|uniref:SagB/ThcOx family dehydrogenase n=1 Tax=Alkalimonas collagenimarina TaxID=400390 RepID=A0ABT9GVP9_9GAMM|nr:SagB/ThcOx family dehydrogenase [Alkalimonas collagenimarina]MDP4535124.1 SagB/ThcOx family dehydrogenase [Alkalimonas collagenimarina]